MATRSRGLMMVPPAPVPQDGNWMWDGERWMCVPCDGPPQPPPCPQPPTAPPWYPPPPNQPPWYPGANGGVFFAQTAPVNPVRGAFWWDGTMLHLFDGAAWVNIGPTAGGGVSTGTTPPASPVTGQLWFDGSVLFVWDGLAWVPSAGTTSYVQATAPPNPNPGDTWYDGTHQWIWDGAAWQLIGTTSTAPPSAAQRSITPVLIPWSATIVPDFSQFINAYINVTGNFILGSPINTTLGQRGIIKLNQDVVGGHTWLVSPGWYFLGGAGAPALSTGANARDLLHYYVGETGIVYGELHVDFMSNSGPTAPPVVTSTPFGNMTLNGGLAAAFDGVNSKVQASSARIGISGAGTLSGYVGKNFSTPQRILSATYWPPTDNYGPISASVPTIQQLGPVTVNLRGKATVPANGSDGTLLASFSYGQPTSPLPSSFYDSAALVPNDMTTAFSYIWIEVACSATGSGVSFLNAFCAQCILDTHT